MIGSAPLIGCPALPVHGSGLNLKQQADSRHKQAAFHLASFQLIQGDKKG